MRSCEATVNGLWRSLVAHRTGGAGVAGSNPVSPTIEKILRLFAGFFIAKCHPYGTSPYYAHCMVLGHCIRLKPTAEQVSYFVKGCGVARFAYNWALAQWRLEYEAGRRPSEASLRRLLNSIKATDFPWMAEVSKNAPQQAIKNLGRAYHCYFEDMQRLRRGEIRKNTVRAPRFKKKGWNDRFRADNGPGRDKDAVRTRGRNVRVPRIGWVKMCEPVRFAGKILSVTISRRADYWFASFAIEVPHEYPERSDGTLIGVDLGITTLATLSDGVKINGPKPLARHLKRVKRLSFALSRKAAGSKNSAKARTKLARLHLRITNIRNDALHKLTTSLTRYAAIVIEDLNVIAMSKNRRIARAISDVGFGEFRRQLAYKTAMSGSNLVVVSKWFPSSKLCSKCGTKNDSLDWGRAVWKCGECGACHDRDTNAAQNLAIAGSSSVNACGAAGSGIVPMAR